jgi:arginase family enzyme
MTPVALIGAASGWGAGFRHTAEGPAALRHLGLAQELAAQGVPAQWRAMVRTEKRWREHPRVRVPETFGLVARHGAALADEVARAIAARRFPVVLGGDHAIAMGSWGGFARALR